MKIVVPQREDGGPIISHLVNGTGPARAVKREPDGRWTIEASFTELQGLLHGSRGIEWERANPLKPLTN